MFKRKSAKERTRSVFASLQESPFTFEGLEGRRLLSGGGHGHGGPGGPSGFGGGPGGASSSITYSLAPTAVQTGLTSLASTDGVTAPTSTSTVLLGNRAGVETYTVDIVSSGTDTKLTVDVNGNPVTAPTRTGTTFGAVTNTAVTSEITAIASALSLTAPTSTTAVSVTTPSSGAATYTVTLASGTTSTGRHSRGTTITVDANGNPVGNERMPLSTLSSAIQAGLTGNAPSGATALTSASLINVSTQNGVTTYSATYTGTGTRTTVSVDTTGALASQPSRTSVAFTSIPTAAQTELQTLATAKGVTLDTTASVWAYDEANGTVIYSIKASATSSTSSRTYPVTLTVDENGNPTVLPGGGDFGGRGGAAACPAPTDTSTTSATGTTASAASRRRH